MRIAYLVLTYDQPEHFRRLVLALATSAARFFVHVDARRDASPFINQVPPSDQVQYVSERVPVYWGGFSQLEAPLRLLQMALSQPIAFHRYCLLSNADYPIKPTYEIEDRLSSNVEFLRVDRLVTPTQPSHSGFLRYHLNDNPFLNPKIFGGSGIGKRLNRLIARIPRRLPRNLPIYHGSLWWALTEGAAHCALDYLREHEDVRRFLKYMHVPGEFAFQSILKASPYANNINHDFEKGPLPPNEHGCHYADWSGPDQGSPKWLDEGDLKAILGSDMLFGRKFHQTRSALLIERLDAIAGRSGIDPLGSGPGSP